MGMAWAHSQLGSPPVECAEEATMQEYVQQLVLQGWHAAADVVKSSTWAQVAITAVVLLTLRMLPVSAFPTASLSQWTHVSLKLHALFAAGPAGSWKSVICVW